MFLSLGLFVSSGIAFSQACVGTAKQCVEVQKKVCANEKADANLDLHSAQHLQGTVKDQSGASFTAGFQIQLRDIASGRIIQTALLDSEGRFVLVGLDGGELRLIVVRLVFGVAQRTGFEQPTHLQCESAEDCTLQIVLKVRPTDQPEDLCPPK